MPTTGKYNAISIGSVNLTTTGLLGDPPCKTRPSGLAALRLDQQGTITKALDGTAYMQISESVKGLPISIEIDIINKSVLDSLVALVNAALVNETLIVVKFDGDTGNFLLSCLPGLPDRDGGQFQPFDWSGEFINGRIKVVTFNFVVQSKGYYLSAGAGSLPIAGQAATFPIA